MSQGQHIQVFVRCRPTTTEEKRSVIEVIPESNEVRVNKSKSFQFDRVFGQYATQSDVYQTVVGPLIEQTLMGFNCTVFAYGQTGTGKTFTMEGVRSDDEYSWKDDPQMGIIPRAISQLFDVLKDHDNEFTVRVSFLELYNEETYDLLSALCDTTRLKIFEDAQRKGSVIVSGLEEIIVQSKDEIYEILKRGSAKRQTAATLLNACSSRSHTIFSVTVHLKEGSIEGEELLKIGKLNLVDLAGSENIGRSGALDKRAREAGNINQSLLTLGRVITALVEKRQHVPYRESKLTRLLQDSLGGRTKTSIIATVSPGAQDLEDTLSTLEYASRAKKITNKPEMNKRLTKKALLKEYTQEIERLRRDLQACHEKNGIYIDEGNYKEMCEKLSKGDVAVMEKEERLKALQDEIEKSKRLFEEFTSNYEQTKAELDKTKERCAKQKILIKAQKELERKLTQQAAELYQVAENATQDNQLLHSKKERIENILRENKAKIERYQPEVNGDISRYESLVELYSQELISLFVSFHQKIQDNIDTNGKVISQMSRDNKLRAEKYRFQSDRLKISVDDLQKQIDHYRTLERECKTQLVNLGQEVESRLNLSRELENLANDLEADKPVPEVITSTMNEFKSFSETNTEKLRQVTATLNSTIKREFGSLKQKFERFFTREIKEDIRTGTTPQKRTYDIPRRLEKPTLDEDILEGFEDSHLDISTSG